MTTATIALAPNRKRQLLARLFDAARKAGAPADQMSNFRAGGYCPQRRQLLFHAAARQADVPDGPTRIGQGGARGGAKSHAAICQVVHDDCMRVPGSKWLYLRSVGKSARESFEDMLTKALVGMMQYYKSSRSRLELPNGSIVILGGFRTDRDIDQYVGIEYDGILIDDAHLVSAERHEKIRGSLRTSKRNWRPRAYYTFNPGGIGHAYLKKIFVEPWRRKQETDTRFFFSLPEDNAFLNPEYVKYLDGLSGWLYRAWRKGDFDIAAGQFFTNWDRNVHVVAPRPISPAWRVWLAMDYGFTHWNVVYLLAQGEDGEIYVVAEHARRRWLPVQNAEGVKRMLDRLQVPKYKLWQFVAGRDCFSRQSDGYTIADKWASAGFDLEPADQDRIAGAAELLDRLGNAEAGVPVTLRIFNTCTRLVECVPSLEHDPRRPEDVRKVNTDEDGNGGDDFYDALRYGLMAARRKEYSPPGVRQYA